MADTLKRKYNLLTLRISLNTTQPESLVRLELQRPVGKFFVSVAFLEFPATELGLPERLDRRESLYQGYNFKIPIHVLNWLKHHVTWENPQRRPLWLHLAKPYGYLGMVPWERLLQPELQMAILRLPDFLANPPRENTEDLDIVLCSSSPTAKKNIGVVSHITQMVKRILEGASRHTTIHIFIDLEFYWELNEELQHFPLIPGTVLVYHPETAACYPSPEASVHIGDRAGCIANPWLLWIREALRERSIDIAHFICHGYLFDNRGALAFSESPVRNEDPNLARFVGAEELTAFLTQVGAWSAAFSSPKYNYSEMGLRQLADTIAQMRPGPIMHHEIPLDLDFSALAAAYRFLFGPTVEPPSTSPALFTYCHPSRLSDQHPRYRPPFGLALGSEDYGEVPHNRLFESLFHRGGKLPSWIIASERFFEQQNLQLQMIVGEPGSERERLASVQRQTLEKIQNIIAEAADAIRFRGEL